MAAGARTRSGRAPDLNALRRTYDGKDWVRLPSEGRQGPIPPWPAEAPDPTIIELHMWARLWRSPQACIWEADQVHDLVALYVRTFISAAVESAPAQRILVAKQLSELLLLTTPSLRSARCIIKGDPLESNLDPQPTNRGSRPKGSVKNRFTVVEETPAE